jgi:alkanesulfonate monooxygenase SsuD/methylene tetrahydromethanopterin reductase-like flavin-dependent oxidoreductase (luciferase family)
MPFDAPGVRVGRLEESLKVLKGLLAGGPLEFAGAHYTVAGLEGFPPPAQRPRPPILVGAGSRRMLGIAGREADIVGILPRALPDGTISEALSERAPAAVAEKVGWVREAAGDRFDRVELSMVATVRVAGDPVAAAARLAAEEGWGGAAERVLEMPSVFLGPGSASSTSCTRAASATASATTWSPTGPWRRSRRWSSASPAGDGTIG